jgi:DNA-binding MarR family transcriptional regulator
MDLFSVENCTCFNLRRVTRLLTQSFDAEMRKCGIRVTQTPVLFALQARRGWSMSELSDWLGMDRTTLVRNLRPLQREGLIKVSGGGRGSHVELGITGKGRAALAKMLPAWRSAQEKVVSTLGEKRWSAILGDFDRVAAELKGE